MVWYLAMSTTFLVISHPSITNKDSHIPRFNTVHYGEHSVRYFGPYIWSRLVSKVKDKPSLQSFQSSIRCINLVHRIGDNCGSYIICNSKNFSNIFSIFLYILVGLTPQSWTKMLRKMHVVSLILEYFPLKPGSLKILPLPPSPQKRQR